MGKKNQSAQIFIPAGANIFVPGGVRAERMAATRPTPKAGKGGRLEKSDSQRRRQTESTSRTESKTDRQRWIERKRESRSRSARRGDPKGWDGQWRFSTKRPEWLDWTEAEDEDDGGGPDLAMSVPPEILALAEQAMTHWKMKVSSMQLAATKAEKGWGAIWKIETDQGPRSFKLLHRPFERNLFSIYAQEYLTQQKARVAPLVRSLEGKLYSIVDNRMFICTEWIEGLHPATKLTVDGAAALCYGLGEFHRHSQGYQPPPDAYFANRLHRWPGVYQKMRSKIDWFEHLGKAYPEMPASRLLLEVLPRFRQQADEALRRLESSAYQELVARGPQAWGLVHQDYGWSNGQLGPDGKVWIIDLDGVAFDLTFRDLRKLITGTMDDRGDWDLTWMKEMIRAYTSANPIESGAMQVMLTDMLLPNEFYKLVKDALFDPAMLNLEMAMGLERLILTDEHKQRALAELGLKRS